MSHGIGKAQRRILEELAHSKSGVLSVVALAERLGCSDRQVRRAVHSLNDRGLVVLTKRGRGHRAITLHVWDPERRAAWLDELDPSGMHRGPETAKELPRPGATPGLMIELRQLVAGMTAAVERNAD